MIVEFPKCIREAKFSIKISWLSLTTSTKEKSEPRPLLLDILTLEVADTLTSSLMETGSHLTTSKEFNTTSWSRSLLCSCGYSSAVSTNPLPQQSLGSDSSQEGFFTQLDTASLPNTEQSELLFVILPTSAALYSLLLPLESGNSIDYSNFIDSFLTFKGNISSQPFDSSLN